MLPLYINVCVTSSVYCYHSSITWICNYRQIFYFYTRKIRYSFVALLSNIYFSCLISKSFSHQNQRRKEPHYLFILSLFPDLPHLLTLSNLQTFFVSLIRKQLTKRRQTNQNRTKQNGKKKSQRRSTRNTDVEIQDTHNHKQRNPTKSENLKGKLQNCHCVSIG